ncbi:VWA domain-containing protein [Halosimplex salinum]|uniref:VWA domain-containing protein n=1 Tax=Halosimplex salinum TaxID=1710538 RepID=UPI000F4823DC|nr:VWA domain-containing protein [Halosimplex salinum]
MLDYGESINALHGRGDRPSLSGIVGQEGLKRAVLAVGANDDLDGLLVRGEKGTAKSTAVRALAGLLPDQEAVADCRYGCPPNESDAQCADCRERADPPTTERSVPFVTLPLGATRERVVGTLSTADALAGDHEFDPGLLARANRGVLYVDEINLLDDHLVDVLLDAAASGVNRVERDGVSVTHPAEFTLVGTMNPEEGDLRPQLRDRFALGVTVTGCDDLDDRVAIIDRALGREGGRTDSTGDGDDARRRQLTAARERLSEVDLPAEFAAEIAELCRDAGVDGHRGDIATARAARTVAALDGRSKVIESDVRRAASLALPHRLRSRPFEDAPDPDDLIDEQFDGGDGEDGQNADEAGGDDDGTQSNEQSKDGDADGSADRDAPERSAGRDGPDPVPDPDGGRADGPNDGSEDGNDGLGSEAAGADRATADDEPDTGDGGEPSDATPLVPGQSRASIGDGRAPDVGDPEALDGESARNGRRARARPSADADGPRVRTERTDPNGSVDAAASIRAAATRGGSSVESRDLRRSVRQSETGALVVFAVDASASMRPAMRAAKGTVLELLKDAYRQRDEVAFVAFAGEDADVLLPPTDSVTRAARHLKDLPTGDRTPLPDALRTTGDVIERADPDAGCVVLVTDGRANVATESPVGETREAARRLAGLDPHVVVVDADETETGLNGLVADETDAVRVPLSALSADRVDAAVGTARETQL